MKRIILLALAVLMLFAQDAVCVKKTLILHPNETTATGYMRLAIAKICEAGNGSYDVIPYHSGMNADTLAAMLVRARTSGDYGLVIVTTSDRSYLTSPSQPAFGPQRMPTYINIAGTPIGIPTLVLASTVMDRASTVPCGIVASPSNWTYGAVGTGNAYDSLKVRLSTGDIVLWNHGTSGLAMTKHVWALPDAALAENAYPWEIDAWVDRGTSAQPGKGATVLMWHFHRTLHDQRELPGQGQDSVIYYLPNFQPLPNRGFGERLKMLIALMKKYDCIETPFEFSFFVDDYGFDVSAVVDTVAVKYWLETERLTDWCVANSVPIQWNTDKPFQAPNVPSKMAKYANEPLVRFGYHPTHTYDDGAATQNSNIFVSWPIGAADYGKVLYRDLRWTSQQMADYWNYVDKSEAVFNTRNYTGKSAYQLQDTILMSLAANGVGLCSPTSSYNGYYRSGASYHTIFYPSKKYPLDVSWATGVSGDIRYMDFKIQNPLFAGVSAAADTAFANPAGLSDSLITNGYTGGATKFYRYFPWWVLTNYRQPDGLSTSWSETNANFPNLFCSDYYGNVVTGHQIDVARRNNGVRYNMLLNWMQHYHANLKAYNNYAKGENPIVSDPFVWVFLKDQKQRPNDRR